MEKFDFRKTEDQEKFVNLPDEQKMKLIEEAHQEALVLNKLRDEIIELLKHEETPEGKSEAQAKITDVFNNLDVCVHQTGIPNLFNILKYGLLSRQKLEELGITYFEGQGTPEDEKLISLTANKAKFGEVILNLTNSVLDDNVALVYFFSEIENKIHKKFKQPVKGIWKGEYLAESQLENNFLRGICVPKELGSRVLSKINTALWPPDSYLVSRNGRVNIVYKKPEELAVASQEWHDYCKRENPIVFHDEQEMELFRNLVLMLTNILGEETTIRDVITLIGKKLHLPVYSIDNEQFTCQATYPENNLPPFTVPDNILD